MIKKNFILIIIFILALLLRLYQLDRLPSILNRDEAALAYNGLLLKQSGKDEWGRNWPLALESFGDYKLIAYSAILSFLFQLFGESDFIVRLPAALIGSFLVILAYFIAEYFKLSKKNALLFALVIGFSPVFFYYSRMAWEANVALFFMLLSLLIILKNINLYFDILASFLYLLAILTYNTPLLLLPFFILIIFFLRIKAKKKASSLITIFLFLILLFSLWQFYPLMQQKSGITIFSDEKIVTSYAQYRNNFPLPLKTLFGNQFIYFFLIIIKKFFQHFSYNFLVANGGAHPWHTLRGFGHIYLLIYLLAIIGVLFCLLDLVKKMFSFLKHSKNKKLNPDYIHGIILLYFLAISILPSAVTVDSPHATRSLFFFFILSLIAIRFFSQINQYFKKYGLIFFILFFAFESINYYYHFFIDYSLQQKIFLPGFDQLIQQVEHQYPNEKITIVANGFQYILLAWYLKIPAENYFAANARQLPDKIGLKYGERITHYHFIADAKDRIEEEKILIEWDNNNKQWILNKF